MRLEYKECIMKYYFIYADGHPNHPLLEWESGSQYFRMCRLAKLPEGFQCAVRIAAPIPETIELPDYLGLPRPVLSSRLRVAIEQAGVRTVQWVPVDLHLPDGSVIKDSYHYMHIAFMAELLDMEQSKYSIDNFGDPAGFESYIMSDEKLKALDSEDAKILCLEEDCVMRVYNQEIVDVMQNLGATGCRYVECEQYGPGSSFAG